MGFPARSTGLATAAALSAVANRSRPPILTSRSADFLSTTWKLMKRSNGRRCEIHEPRPARRPSDHWTRHCAAGAPDSGQLWHPATWSNTCRRLRGLPPRRTRSVRASTAQAHEKKRLSRAKPVLIWPCRCARQRVGLQEPGGPIKCRKDSRSQAGLRPGGPPTNCQTAQTGATTISH